MGRMARGATGGELRTRRPVPATCSATRPLSPPRPTGISLAEQVRLCRQCWASDMEVSEPHESSSSGSCRGEGGSGGGGHSANVLPVRIGDEPHAADLDDDLDRAKLLRLRRWFSCCPVCSHRRAARRLHFCLLIGISVLCIVIAFLVALVLAGLPQLMQGIRETFRGKSH